MTVSFLSRTAWGAGALKAGYRVPHVQFKGLVVHHTVMVDEFRNVDDVIAYMRRLQTARPDLSNEVPYSFVVFPTENEADCIVAEGRGFGVTGAHTTGFNSSRYGVAYAGNASVDHITEGVLSGYRWVGQRLDDPAGAERTLGHRDTKATECPGDNLYARLDDIQPPFEEDDMALTTSEHTMLANTNHRVVKVVMPQLVKVLDELAELRREVAALKPSDG